MKILQVCRANDFPDWIPSSSSKLSSFSFLPAITGKVSGGGENMTNVLDGEKKIKMFANKMAISCYLCTDAFSCTCEFILVERENIITKKKKKKKEKL